MLKSLKRLGPIFLSPTPISPTLAFLAPSAIGLYLSLCKFMTIANASFIGTQNYIDAFSEGQGFVHTLLFTAAIMIVSMITVSIFVFAIACILTRKPKDTNFLHTVFFMSNLTGGTVLGYTQQTIINAVLLHQQATPVTDAKYSFIDVIILPSWRMVGYMMIIYITGLQAVPKDLVEAAEIDGVDKQPILRSVTILMMMPSITICLFLALSNPFRLSDQNLALTNDQPPNTTEIAALNVVNTFFARTGLESTGQAKIVIFFLLVSLIAFIQPRATRGKGVKT